MSTFSNPQRFCHTWVWISFHPQFQLQSADIYNAGEQRAARWLYWDCCCWLLISLDPRPWCCSWLTSCDPDPRLLYSTWSLSSMHQKPQFLASLVLDCAYCQKWSLPEIRKGGKRYSGMLNVIWKWLHVLWNGQYSAIHCFLSISHFDTNEIAFASDYEHLECSWSTQQKCITILHKVQNSASLFLLFHYYITHEWTWCLCLNHVAFKLNMSATKTRHGWNKT